MNLLFLSLFLPFFCCAKFMQTSSFLPIKREILKEIDTDSLIIFGCENVLIAPKDKILLPYHISYLKKYLDRKIRKKYKINERANAKKEILSIAFKDREIRQVEPHILNFIKETRYKETKIIIFINSKNGPFGQIKSMEDWKMKELNTLEYDLRSFWPNLASRSLIEKFNKTTRKVAFFKNGILFNYSKDKLVALKSFLNYSKIRPSKIFFISEDQKDFKDFENYLKRQEIDFFGFEYTAIRNTKLPLNSKVARTQCKKLIKEKIWLSDKEAQKALKKCKKE